MSTSTSPPPLRLAATVIPLRDTSSGLEVLMVRRNMELSFGGMWTFPGGGIDDDDGPQPDRVDESEQDWLAAMFCTTAAHAACRELREETALTCDPDRLTLFSHWIPPRDGGPPKRFATWFFVSTDVSGQIELDTSENSEARWLEPAAALDAHAAGELPMAVPTWVTLDDLRAFTSLAEAGAPNEVRVHHTRATRADGHLVLCWRGDSAYETGDFASDGARNRIRMDPAGPIFGRERSA